MEIPPDTPTAIAPEGVVPNFIDPVSHGYEAVITVSICLSLMVPFVVMRIYANAFVTRHLGWDDYTCVLGAMGAIAFAATCVSLIRFGFGTHQWDLTFGRLGSDGFKYLLIQEELYGPAFFFIKLSIFLLYLRIFSPKKLVRIVIYAGITVVLLSNLVVTILFPVFCAPRKSEDWVSSYSTDRCKNHTNNTFIASATLNFATDIYILVIPLPIVWKLHLSTNKRIGLILTFATGILACGASLGALIFRIKFGFNSDYTYYSLRNIYMSIIEMNVGLIASCAPACASLFRHKKSTLQRFPFFFFSSFSSPLTSLRHWRLSKFSASSSKTTTTTTTTASDDVEAAHLAKANRSIMVHSRFTVVESRQSAEPRPDRDWYFELGAPAGSVSHRTEIGIGNGYGKGKGKGEFGE